jgi:nitrogen fixation-related uncharacterized protein
VIPSSLIVIAATSALTLLAALVMLWAWRRGFFDDLDAQSKVIFEPSDWRTERPWETDEQRSERARAFGPLVAPSPGEWGGAA